MFFFTISFAVDNIKPQEENLSRNQTLYDLERETFDAVTFSIDLPLLPKEYCDHVIATVPLEVQEIARYLINPVTRKEALPTSIIFCGPSGSGKSTLARVIVQEMGAPFMIVKASMLANEYVNSGSGGLRRIAKLLIRIKGNLVIDELDTLAQKKNKKTETEDDTPKALWELLDIISANNLLFIGTTNDVSGMPEQLQQRLLRDVCEIPYLNHVVAIKQVILNVLNGKRIDSPETIEKFIREIKNYSKRDINHIVYLAFRFALDRNIDSPIITLDDFRAANKQLDRNKKLLQQTKWDKKEVFEYTVKTVNMVVGIVGMFLSIISLKNGFESIQLAVEALLNNKEVAAKAEGRAVKSLELQKESMAFAKETAKESLSLQKNLAVESRSLQEKGLQVN